ncbi:MAG: sugar kinase [Candidatus Eisenbacteria bacterium]|uniref:Sugar kinase n=1 Tax=Eiseniibacteriota bacterium TaxID=2212470 RepID=A0A849SHV7_UNCEI|nr:sugar kinase [Candidatus Eisenbacteria bacterium]
MKPPSRVPSDIAVVGSVALDSIRTPFGMVEDALGGSASYFAFSASHFAPVRIVAVVGDDFPVAHRERFQSRGIDLSGLETAPGRTFRWRGEYAAELGHAHTLETQLNVFSTFHPRLEPAHRESPFVFLANIDPDLQLEVLGQMESPRLILSDTMNYWIARKPDRVIEVLRRVDVALLNEEEARALSGETQLVRAAGKLLDEGARAVIVKKGEHGALYRSRKEMFITPAYPVSGLWDPTGAGDSFAGGFIGWLARSGRTDGDALRQALAVGAAMASLAIEAFSPERLVSAGPDEITSRVESLHRMVHFTLEPLFTNES